MAALELPRNDTVHFEEIEIAGKVHVVVLKRLPPFNVFVQEVGISAESWTLGFVVSRDEIAALMRSATEVGGDYYDVLPAPNGMYLGFAIAVIARPSSTAPAASGSARADAAPPQNTTTTPGT